MLFRYLLCSIAVASSVVCYLPSASPSYSNGSPSFSPRPVPRPIGNPSYDSIDSSFQDCTQKVRELSQPIAYACQQQASEQVSSSLRQVYYPFHALSIQFQAAVKIDASIGLKSFPLLVNFLVGFDAIVGSLALYPLALQASHSIIQSINTDFENIFSTCLAAGISIKQVFSTSIPIRFELFRQVGFTFQDKLGFEIQH